VSQAGHQLESAEAHSASAGTVDDRWSAADRTAATRLITDRSSDRPADRARMRVSRLLFPRRVRLLLAMCTAKRQRFGEVSTSRW
jgi:hypothetical protein